MKKRTCLILATVCSIGCSYEDTQSRVSSLVFDFRKSYQSRVLMNLASSESDIPRQNALIQSSLLSEGAAVLLVDGYYHNDIPKLTTDPEMCSVQTDVYKASSILASPDRLVTAHHNIANRTGSMSVQFNSNSDGNWTADPDTGAIEENPLLANRLAQIGLDYWALNKIEVNGVFQDSVAKAQVRPELRTWYVELDLDSAGGGQLGTQPFFDLSTEKVKDIAFLKITGSVIEIVSKRFIRDGLSPYTMSFYSESKPFTITKPGVFFNQASTQKYSSAQVNSEDGYTKFQAIGTPPWMNVFRKLSDNAVVGTVSALIEGETECSPHNVCTGTGNNFNIFNYEDCVSTSAGSVSGYSGGAMLMPYLMPDGVKKREIGSRYAFGVLQSSSENGDGSWDNVVESDNGLPTEHQTVFTMGGEDYKNWGTRHTPTADSDPFNPVPIQPGDSVPESLGEDEYGPIYSQPVGNSVWGKPTESVQPDDYPRNAVPAEPSSATEWRNNCNYSRYVGTQFNKNAFRVKAGMAIGIVGTSAKKFVNEEGNRVESIGVICAPWSSASWSDNWYWLLKSMRPNIVEGSAFHNYIWQPVLRLALPMMTEWRKDTSEDTPYLRPMSMKTCPPNSNLIGLDVYYNTTTNILTGVNGLICESDDRIFKKPLRPLREPGGGTIGDFSWTYTVNNDTFTVDQHIGNSIGDNESSVETLSCPVDNNGVQKVVSGLQMEVNSSKEITNFWLECIQSPN